jgi:Helix-turn-helix family
MANQARTMWTLLEPIHGVTYFSDAGKQALVDAGLRGFWRGYFAGRAAPLGAAGPGVVTAIFYNFAPRMVYRALPAVWELATPPVALAARLRGSAAALREILPSDPSAVLAPLEMAAAALTYEGRPLAAANAELPPATDPYERLWELATLFREHRGDGHFASLVAAGLDGCEVLALRAASDLDRGLLQQARSWTDEEWEAARSRLVERGWLAADGALTEAGRDGFAAVEEATDRAAARPWQVLPPDEFAKLTEQLTPLAAAIPRPAWSPMAVPPV